MILVGVAKVNRAIEGDATGSHRAVRQRVFQAVDAKVGRLSGGSEAAERESAN